MKKIGFVFLILILSSCIGHKRTDDTLLSILVLRELNKNNIEYLNKETPSGSPKIGEYRRLVTADSTINIFIQKIDKNQANMDSIALYVNKINNEMKLFGDSIPLYSSAFSLQNKDNYSIKQSLVMVEYLYGNYLIKLNSKLSLNLPLEKVINKPKDDTISLGEIYETQILLYGFNPLAPYYVEIENKRIDYPLSGEIPIYRFKSDQKGHVKKHGKFYYYNSMYSRYDYKDFSFEFYVK